MPPKKEDFRAAGPASRRVVGSVASIRRFAARINLAYVFLEGADLTALPLLERKARLEALLKAAPNSLQYNDHQIGRGPEFHRFACERGLEASFRSAAMADTSPTGALGSRPNASTERNSCDMHNPIAGIVFGIAQPNAKASVRLIVVANEYEIADLDNDAVQILKDPT